MLKAYKYRISPDAGQKAKIDQTIGICRLVYNLALDVKIRAWKDAEKSLSAFDLINQLPDLKETYPWISEVDSQALQASVKKVDVAFKNFFKGGGYPKFKSRKKGIQSFQCPNNTRKVDFKKGLLIIPKIANIPIIIDRTFDDKIRNITISRTPTGKYYASILVDNGVALPIKPEVTPAKTIGIDVGLKSFVITSDGRSFAPNRHLKQNLDRLKILQRRASKKKKGSHNRKKANLCVAKLHEKISFSRLDYIHKVTTQLIRDNQAESFVIETLNVSGLLKNHKLAQSISDVSWGKFFEVLQYKCDWYGKNLIKIGRFEPSSKRCSNCGHIKESLSLAEREWMCSECTTLHDRDINAAKNIKYFGLETIFQNKTGAVSSEAPVERRRLRQAKKQETSTAR